MTRCIHTTLKGSRCKRAATSGQYCTQHCQMVPSCYSSPGRVPQYAPPGRVAPPPVHVPQYAPPGRVRQYAPPVRVAPPHLAPLSPPPAYQQGGQIGYRVHRPHHEYR